MSIEGVDEVYKAVANQPGISTLGLQKIFTLQPYIAIDATTQMLIYGIIDGNETIGYRLAPKSAERLAALKDAAQKIE